MKSVRIAILFGIAALGWAKSPAEESFDRLKTLVGSWQGHASTGKALDISFRETSAGSALLSEIHSRGESPEDMVSMIHLDRSRLVLTHYCTAGNQPRMAASASPDGKTFTFDFFDSTNLADLADGHMWRVVIRLIEADHHTETWMFLDHGKKTTEVYDLRRGPIAK